MSIKSSRWSRFSTVAWCAGVAIAAANLSAQVLFSEIMYHPVEEAAFNADGTPVMDLTEEVHEFLELHNPGAAPVSLKGWQLTGGIQYTFPPSAVIQPGQYLVVARNPARLANVPVYQLQEASLFGPYLGQLNNNGETLRLRNARNELIDSVSYSSHFPWAIGADALGADEDWTGLRNLDFQYTGRSLERVSFAHPANDPANWLASPAPGAPSPGHANSIQRNQPLPVVVQLIAHQSVDQHRLIRQNQPVRMDAAFSATNQIEAVELEYFVDNIELTTETITNVLMTATGDASSARFTALIPGLPDRSIVRYRIVTTQAGQREVISPRADDPFRWHAYFVSPNRTSTKPVYDCFISSVSLSRLNSNINRSPRRVTTPDPPGNPRVSWNATEPAIFVHDGEVRDIQMRHHGSRYNRSPGRNSFKWFFPRYHPFQGTDSIFETDKGNDFVVGHGLFINAGLPVSSVRYVDLFLNNNAGLQRLEQGEFNGDMLDSYHQAQQPLNPGTPLESSGEIFKSVGTIEVNGEGPYGRGDGRRLAKLPTWPDLKMYEWTYSLQNHGWRGHTDFAKMIDALWVARGDTPSSPAPKVPAVRNFFDKYFDIDAMLTYVAVENWACPWDDTTQNHFLWRRSNGKWGMLPWDCDAWFGRGDNTPASASIYIGEVGNPNNNFRGPNFVKDGFIKGFRQEYKERLYLLNNTFLHPDNITAMGFGSIRSFANSRFAAVNQQCGFGPFQRPAKPVNLSPSPAASVAPNASLKASPYTHSADPASPHSRTTWEIRRDDGTFLAPLLKVTSTGNLTNLSIPFAELDFGRIYFWRCTYLDAQNHPSLISDETPFTFGNPTPTQTNLVSLIRIDARTLWKYNQSGANLGTAWVAPSFDDSLWASGPALLAVENAALPEPIRTPLTLGPITFYFRHHFQYNGPATAQLRLHTVIDDGAVLYLNGKNIWNTRVQGSPPLSSTLADSTVSDAVYEGPFEVSVTNLLNGENVLAAEVHQVATTSSDLVFGISLDVVSVSLVVGDVVLNEVLADNRTAAANAGDFPDYVELYNTSNRTVDLTGFALSDSPLKPSRFVFPADTAIPARGYLRIWCDDATRSPGLHTGFGLDAKGQTVVLLAPSPNNFVVKDSIVFGLQAPNFSIGRIPDGAGFWQLNQPTPNAVNKSQATASPDAVIINEWLANPISGEDWFELFNPLNLPVALGGLFLTDDLNQPTQSPISSLSFMPAEGFVTFAADGDPDRSGNHVNFKLSTGGDTIALISTNSLVLNSVIFGPQASGVSEGRLPDGGTAIVSFPSSPTPDEPNYLLIRSVVINEVLTHSDPPEEDAIELLNTSDAPVDIGGWYLSDDVQVPKKYRIPTGTIVPAGGFHVVYEFQFSASANSADRFALSSAHGDNLVLAATKEDGSLTGHREVIRFGAAFKGISFGRYLTSTSVDFIPMSGLSFGSEPVTSLAQFREGTGRTNLGPRISPVVISEIMFHPPDVQADGQANDNTAHEFIELRNATATEVPLFDPTMPTSTWRIRGGVQLDLPPGLTLPVGGVLLLVNFAPTNLAEAASFRAAYSMSEKIPLIGPFRGKLGNSRDQIELLQPDHFLPGQNTEEIFVPYVMVERIVYADKAPWPIGSDGSGLSLQRIAFQRYGNDPVNWKSGAPSPGDSLSPTTDTDSDHDGLPDIWEHANGLNLLNPTDALLDQDGDGMTNFQEYRAGTNPRDADSRLQVEFVQLAEIGEGAIELRFLALANLIYQVEYREALTVGTWVPLGGVLRPASPGPVTVPDSLPPGFIQRYYRVRIP
ncbi:MAG: hypothetical protein EXS36_18290 [Pedosphaera sp.]|nr:hypothetical protein [Pedosphaera sp.]